MKKIETGKGASQFAVLYRYTFLLEVTMNRKVLVPSLSPSVYHHRKIKHICYSLLFLPIVHCLKVLTPVPKESTFSWFCFFARRSILPTHAQSLQSSLDSLQPHGLQPAKLLCSCNSPGKNTGVGLHALLQGIFPTQRSNSGLMYLLHRRQILYH